MDDNDTNPPTPVDNFPPPPPDSNNNDTTPGPAPAAPDRLAQAPAQSPSSPATAAAPPSRFVETDQEMADGRIVLTTTDTVTGKVTTGGQSADASGHSSNPSNSNSQDASNSRTNDGNSGGGGDSNDDDDDDNGDNSESAPVSKDEEEAERERKDEESGREVVVTPVHPDFQKDRGAGNELLNATGGRLGKNEAKNALRNVELQNAGGGAGGPSNNPNSAAAPVTLLLGEVGILSKTASGRTEIKTTGGAVDPSPVDKSSTAVTERDLKELGLRGTGGAKGPTDQPAQPSAPLDPNNPLAGPAPMAPPSTRAETATQALEGIRTEKIQINVDTSAVEAVVP